MVLVPPSRGDRVSEFLDSLPQLVWTCEPGGACDYVNARWAEYTGLAAEKQMGYGWLEQIHPADRDGLRKAWDAAITSGTDIRGESRIRRHDGSYRWFLCHGTPLKDASGRTTRWVGFSTDIDDARASRETLRLERELLAQVTATAPGMIYSFRLRDDGRTCVPYANARIEHIFGLTPGEVAADAAPWFERIHPEDVDWVRRAMKHSAEALCDWVTEYRVVHPQRGTLWVDGRSRPVRDAEGVLWHGVVYDVTERKRVEHLMRQKETLLAQTSALAKIGGWEFDPVTGRGTWTEEVARIHDLDPSQDANVELGLSFYRGEWREKMEAAVRNVVENGQPYDLEVQMVTARTVKWVRTVGFPVFRDGRVVRIQGVLQDITDRRRAEETLRQSEERFRQLTDNIQEVFWITDPAKQEMLYVSPAYERIWGRTCRSLYHEPRSWIAALHPEDRDRVLHAAVTRQSQGTYDEEYRICRPDGSVRWIHDRAFPVRDEGGRTYRIVGVAEDVSARKAAEGQRRELEDRLRQSQKLEAVGQLAGGIAHDFNNMLSVILGYTELALSRMEGADPLAKTLRGIQGAAQRSADLTRQLLAFSRQQPVAPRVIDLNAQARGMERLLQRLIGEDIDLTFSLAESLWPVSMDPTQVDQVVANLAVNARDAMPNGGKLTVETRNVAVDEASAKAHGVTEPGDYVALTVSDTGAGMDKATLARVFEPFFTTKTDGRGTGLGLAMVYGVAKQNGGFINIYSEVGHGTAVRLYLPRHAGDATLTTTSMAVPPARGHETILLVEDEEELREIAKELLEELGYTVLDAATPEAAIALSARHTGVIDLLFTDVVMPAMNGKMLAERIRAQRPSIHVLFASGYTADAIAHRGVLEAGIDFIEKPFTIDSLAQKTREALARR